MPLAVIEKRKADAQKARENKEKIKKSLESRPSLIERHNQVRLCILHFLLISFHKFSMLLRRVLGFQDYKRLLMQ